MNALSIALLCARALPVVELLPCPVEQVPRAIRLAWVAGLVALLYPAMPEPHATTASTVAALLAIELFIGVLLGLVGRLIYEAITIAGRLTDRAVLCTGPATTAYQLLFAVLFFAMASSYWIEAWIQTYTVVPAGSFANGNALPLARVFAEMFALGIQLSCPILFAGLLADLLTEIVRNQHVAAARALDNVSVRRWAALAVLFLSLGTVTAVVETEANDLFGSLPDTIGALDGR